MTTSYPDRLVVVVGTYDGVLAGWDSSLEGQHDLLDKAEHLASTAKIMLLHNHGTEQKEGSFLKLKFAMPVHEGSVRTVSIASGEERKLLSSQQEQALILETGVKKRKRETNAMGELHLEGHDHPSTRAETTHTINVPEIFISAGFDETMAVFSMTKGLQSGELKTPSDLGTPTSSCFAPPSTSYPSHALLGMSSGKIIIYLRKDWSVQHILSGHDDRGVTCIAVHPSGKLALSGGKDGKIILWDLLKGKLAFVYKIPNPAKGVHSTVNDIVWTNDGNRFAFSTHDGKITAREAATGLDLLDIQLPNRANQVTFIGGDEGLFLAAACDDGSLPVFLIQGIEDTEEEEENDDDLRRAIMAIEPVIGPSAGDERFKCIRSVKGGSGFLVVTANSGGCVSLIDLEHAAQMILEDDDVNEHGDDSSLSDQQKGSSDEESDNNDESENALDLAAEILDSVRVGSGARITCLSAWSSSGSGSSSSPIENQDKMKDEVITQEDTRNSYTNGDSNNMTFSKKRNKKSLKEVEHSKNNVAEVEKLDKESLEKARALVKQAKKHQKRMEEKKAKSSK